MFSNNCCENQVCYNTALEQAGFEVNSNFAFFISNIIFQWSLDNVLHPMLLCQTVVRTGLVGSRLWNQYLLRAQFLQQGRQTTLSCRMLAQIQRLCRLFLKPACQMEQLSRGPMVFRDRCPLQMAKNQIPQPQSLHVPTITPFPKRCPLRS